MIAIRKFDTDGEEIEVIEEPALVAARAVCQLDVQIAKSEARRANDINPRDYCHKIDAIRMIRQLTGMHLHDAKDFYERETGCFWGHAQSPEV